MQPSEHGNLSTSAPVGEINGRIDQVALVERTLRNGAIPTLVARMAILVAHMQTQIDHPDLVLTITSGIGSFTRTAPFQDGIWHGFDLIHDLDNQSSFTCDLW